jgi:ligand-binding sensor domain-containing protein
MASSGRLGWQCFALLALLSCKGAGPSPGALWYAAPAICGFTASQLTKSNSENPDILVTAIPFTSFNDLALDRDGHVWVVGAGANFVSRLPSATVAASGGAAADLVIESTVLDHPSNLVFDASGNLWVVSQGSGSGATGTVARFDAPQALSGVMSLIPSFELTNLEVPGALAFDAQGSLWLTTFNGIARFDRVMDSSGIQGLAPDALIAKSGYPNNVYFYGIAFDASGALWASVSIGNSLNSVMKFADPGSLSGASSPAPAVTIDGGGEALPAGGLAFDAAGQLWLATSSTIVEYADPASYSGILEQPTPAVTLDVVNDATPSLNAHLVFHPSPPGLPLY